jgi:hypothetical protein
MLAAVVSASVASCAGTPAAPGAPGQSHGTNQSAGGGAPGAPIQIPAKFDDEGRPLAEVTSEIQSGIRAQCGGELCVTLRTEHRDIAGFTSCQFVRTEPGQRTFVARGSIIVIVAGSELCETTPTTGDTTTSPTTDSTPSESQPTP